MSTKAEEAKVVPTEQNDPASIPNVYASQPARGTSETLHEPPARRTGRSTRVTTTPDTPPPQLLCPTCDRPLVYRQTVISGVKPIERWDYFECRTCGAFVYRDRTRKLRPASN